MATKIFVDEALTTRANFTFDQTRCQRRLRHSVLASHFKEYERFAPETYITLKGATSVK